jgi:hypothetical protein
MIDPTTIRLNEALYRERLQAANAARRWRATRGAALSPIERLRRATGKQLMSLGQRMQVPGARAGVYR